MLFNSISFLVFFPIVIVAYWSLPHKYRWTLLLAASYVFYMFWKVEYVFLILFSTLIDYYAARQLAISNDQKRRKHVLWISLGANLGTLFIFKYLSFFTHSLFSLAHLFGISMESPTLQLLLPVGISFYTFQSMSYTIDVYNGKTKAENHFGIFALYVSFFPQLVAGPIERSSHLLPELTREKHISVDMISKGLKRILIGFFKKVVVADRLAEYVNLVYAQPELYEGQVLILATVFFAFQIYCDFSGYSDIAIGVAEIMGIRLMNNFKSPYFATSISNFWSRWHISLSTWFRDYVYIPLGGNRVKKTRWIFNLWVTFLVSGLWHGANWTFVVWGALHGFYIVVTSLIAPLLNNLSNRFEFNWMSHINKLISIGITFVLVDLAWIFFRAKSLEDAFLILRRITLLDPSTLGVALDGFGATELILSLAMLMILFLIEVISNRDNAYQRFMLLPNWVRWLSYQGMLVLIWIFGVFTKQEFIYFQF